MALAIVDGRRPQFIAPEVGAYLWRILNCEVELKDDDTGHAWEQYAARVNKLYLNPHSPHTPKSYLEKHYFDSWNTQPVRLEREQLILWNTRKDLV